MITLKTLHEATEAEVIRQVGEHLLHQMRRSVDKDGICKYRSAEGLKCAAGCLIADDEYDETFENSVWRDLVLQKRVPPEHEDLIRKLQYIHDEYRPKEWAGCLRTLCRWYHVNASWIYAEGSK